MAVADTDDHLRLSSPRIFLVRIVVFLILIGFIALILYQQISRAFMANPGLNGFIFFVLLLGIIYGIRNVARLFREARWVNALPHGEASNVTRPILLAPMATLFGDRAPTAAMSTVTLRVILDSIGTRLDEARELSRYLTGLLIFLGLLGTFWGLIQTVGSIAHVIESMGAGADSAASFEELKAGLAVPLSSMSLAFTSSLFGLAGSLILGLHRPAGRPGAEPVLHRARGRAHRADLRRADRRRQPRSRQGAGAAERSLAGARLVGGFGQSRRGHPVSGPAHARRAAADPRLGRGAGRPER